MAYVVESADWNLNGKNSKEVLEAIERFLGCLGDAKQAGIPVWFGEEFQHQAVLGHEDLWSLSREDSPLPLPTEVWQELSAYLGQATYYADHEDWPEGFPTFIDIEIEASPPTPNLDVALAHHSIRAGIAMACVGADSNLKCNTRGFNE